MTLMVRSRAFCAAPRTMRPRKRPYALPNVIAPARMGAQPHEAWLSRGHRLAAGDRGAFGGRLPVREAAAAHLVARGRGAVLPGAAGAGLDRAARRAEKPDRAAAAADRADISLVCAEHHADALGPVRECLFHEPAARLGISGRGPRR